MVFPVVRTLLIGLLLVAAAGDLWVVASRGTTRGTAGCIRGGGVAFGGVGLASLSSRGFDGVFGADNRSGKKWTYFETDVRYLHAHILIWHCTDADVLMQINFQPKNFENHSKRIRYKLQIGK